MMSTKPKYFIVPVLALVLGSALMSGCSSGPSGAPSGFAANRLTVTMQLQAPVNNAYIYSFAFDDDDNAADGPQAIVASTTLPNGVVAGSFTVLVQYEGGQWIAYRRTELAGGGETLERSTQAFSPQPSPTTGNTLTFTLNLDALTDSGTRLFGAGTQRLDLNFVTANERRRDPADNTRKAFDAFGPGSASSYATLDIRSTRTYSNSSSSIGEPTNDVSDFATTGVDLRQLDIVDFSIDVVRS